MLEFLGRHWRGEYSLARSFWVNGLLGSLFLGLYFIALAVSFPEGPESAPGWNSSFLVLSLIFDIWLGVGQWRAANRHIEATGHRFWARAVQVFVVLTFLSLGQSVYSALSG